VPEAPAGDRGQNLLIQLSSAWVYPYKGKPKFRVLINEMFS